MPILVGVAQNLTTAQDICNQALWGINAIPNGDPAGPDDGGTALAMLNNLLDLWNAKGRATYGSVFNVYPITAGLNPHTIGPTGATFTATQRPQEIEGANLVVPGTTTYRTPINVRDKRWWLNQRVRSLSTSEPTDLYYANDWPNGSIYFWPVPASAYQVELLTKILLARLNLASAFSLPPAYQLALTLTLSEYLCPSYEKTASEDLKHQARDARATAYGSNEDAPRIDTNDAGIPGGTRRSDDTYLSGWWPR